MFHVYAETRDRKSNRRMKPGWANGGNFLKRKSAERYSAFLRLTGSVAWVESDEHVAVDHKVLVKKRDLTGWREAEVWGKKRFRRVESYAARTKLRKQGREVKVQEIPNQLADDNRLIEK